MRGPCHRARIYLDKIFRLRELRIYMITPPTNPKLSLNCTWFLLQKWTRYHTSRFPKRGLSSHNPMHWIFTITREASQVLPYYQSCMVSARRQFATSGLVGHGRRRHGIWTILGPIQPRKWGGRLDAKTLNQGSREACALLPNFVLCKPLIIPS